MECLSSLIEGCQPSSERKRADEPRLIIPAHLDDTETQHRHINFHHLKNALGKFSHRMNAACSDESSSNAAIFAAMHIRTEQRFNNIVNVDEVQNLRTGRDCDALAFSRTVGRIGEAPSAALGL
jgi:hypothetical protein